MTKANDDIPKKRRRIGLIIDWLGGTYQSEIWRGVRDAAEAADVNLFCFSGGSLKSPYGFWRRATASMNSLAQKALMGLSLQQGQLPIM